MSRVEELAALLFGSSKAAAVGGNLIRAAPANRAVKKAGMELGVKA